MQDLKISESVKSILQDFVRSLQDIFKGNLVSVILYGSAASGEFVDKHSNLNLLVVLSDAALDSLRSATRLVNKFKFRMIDPLFFSLDYIKTSCDVFPIEFLDMKENYAVLLGEDVLKDVQIDTRNLRFQCEQELKAKLIALKQSYLHGSKNKSALKYLLFKYFTSVVHILKNMLRLKGKTPPYLKQDILKEAEREFQIKTDSLKKILSAKNKEVVLSSGEIDSVFVGFASELEKIVNMVDKL